MKSGTFIYVLIWIESVPFIAHSLKSIHSWHTSVKKSVYFQLIAFPVWRGRREFSKLQKDHLIRTFSPGHVPGHSSRKVPSFTTSQN